MEMPSRLRAPAAITAKESRTWGSLGQLHGGPIRVSVRDPSDVGFTLAYGAVGRTWTLKG